MRVRQNRSGVRRGGRLFSLKVIIHRVKTSMRAARLTFLNRHCARSAFLLLSLSLSSSLSLSLSPSLFHFYLFVRCVAATGRGAQLPGMTLRIGCFDGITYPHEITIRHFARTRSSVIPFARCLFARKMVKNWARKVYLLFLLAFGFSARAEFYSIINKATAVGAKRLIIFSFCPFFLVFSKEVFSAIIKRKLRRFILTFMRR